MKTHQFIGMTVVTVGLLTHTAAFAQSFVDAPADAQHWLVEGDDARLETYGGVRTVYLGDGTATLKDVAFTNGIVEFDMLFAEEFGFPGIQFRAQSPTNYENFYFRPHLSGKPDANQYTPVYNGLAGWQLYHGERYSFLTEYKFDEWMHVRLVISGQHAELFLGDSNSPDITVKLQRPVRSGGITFGGSAKFRVANVRYAAVDDAAAAGIQMKGTVTPAEPLPDTIVRAWQVSDGFAEDELGTQLTQAQQSQTSWRVLAIGPEGSINIATVATRAPERNTVFARLVINATTAGVRKFSFGYSDRAYIYFNGDLMYSGGNEYRSRDYRYLGTIGIFDHVYLPLEAGRNELWIAVAEDFGGWGLTGMFDDMRGITLAD